jgi:hypothetical protein
VQGDWVGQYGTQGYVIAAWNQATSDLVVLPAGVTFALEQGSRVGTGWPQPTADVRALENSTETQRRAGAWSHANTVRLRLTFTSAYIGMLHLYAVDWASTTRREDITVEVGAVSRTAQLTTSFNGGAWIHYPVTVQAGGSIVIRAEGTAKGKNSAVLSGLFLGGPGAPLP